jgi:carboxymethylenebutenolidase
MSTSPVEIKPGHAGFITFGADVQGFLAVPEYPERSAGAVILGHERYGLVQHTQDLALKFAGDGYTCLAPDLYSHWDGDRAAMAGGELAPPFIADTDIARYMSAGLDFLLESTRVDDHRIVSMGVCLSGSYPLILNSTRHELAASIVVYGGAQANEWEAVPPQRLEPYEAILGRITAPVLGIWGEDDFIISVDHVRRLRNVLEEQRKSYEFVLYRDMPHGWFNSTMPGRYRPEQTERAWARILDFIERACSGAFPRDRAIWRFESDISRAYDFATKVRLA